MADVTGPISTLRGSHHALPDGAMCDQHRDRAATARIQGETDSFGSEMIDACDECRAEIRKGIEEERVGTCDWCSKAAADLRDHRDFEEGMSGPVYRVCGSCVQKELKRLAEESTESNRYCDEW